jgi:hypothetical protein
MKRKVFFGFVALLFVIAARSTITAQTVGPLEGNWQGGSQRLIFTGNKMFVGDEYGDSGEFEFIMVQQVTKREIYVFEDYNSEDEYEVMYYKLRGDVLSLYETEEDYDAETGMVVFARMGNIKKSPLEGVWEGDDSLIEFTGNMMIIDESDACEFSYTDNRVQFRDEELYYKLRGNTLFLYEARGDYQADTGEMIFAKK